MPVVFISVDPKLMEFREGALYGMGDDVISAGGRVTDRYPFLNSNAARKSEFEVKVEFYEPDGNLGFTQNAGMAIAGNWGSLPYPQKSLALFARKKYGKGKFKHQIFRDSSVPAYESFVLHNGGNDNQGSHQTATKRRLGDLSKVESYGSYFVNGNFTYLRDPLLQRLNANTHVDTQAARPCVVYVNDEYWGLYTLREKLNEHYVLAHSKREKGTIDLISGFGAVNAGSNDRYFLMRQHTDRLSGARKARAGTTAEEFIDLDNFIDYQLAIIYAENFDLGNVRCWCPIEDDGSGRFRFILFGQDYGFGLWPQAIYKPAMAEDYADYDNMFRFCTANPNQHSGWPLGEGRTAILHGLGNDPRFRNRFVLRLSDLLNTIYREDHVESTIREMAAVIRPEIPQHLARWSWPELVRRGFGKPHVQESTPFTAELWDKHVEGLSQFARTRPGKLRQDCATHFGFRSESGVLEVALDPPDSGTLRINSLTLSSNLWRGVYFADLTNSLRVIPAAGYQWGEWTTRKGRERSANLLLQIEPGMTNRVIARMERVGQKP